MWDLPGPGIELMSPALADGFLTTRPTGKSCQRPIIAEFGGEGAGIYTLQLTPNKLGAGNHPSLEAHYAASEQLTAFIKEKNLLDNVN